MTNSQPSRRGDRRRAGRPRGRRPSRLTRHRAASCFEAGDSVGASVREWGHVRVFSPWDFNIDPVAARLLEQQGWSAPPADGYPTGDEIVDRYLEPLAARAGDRREPAPADAGRDGVTRLGIDKLKDAGRDEAPLPADRRRGRRGASVPGARGDRRFRHLDTAEPAGRRRRARGRRARARRPHRLRHPRRARRRAGALRGQARARRRQRPFRLQRDPRPRHAARHRAGHRDRVGDPRRRARATSYGGGGADQLPARGALGAIDAPAGRRRLGRARRRVPDPRSSPSHGDRLVVRSDGSDAWSSTRSSPPPASVPTSTCCASCASTSTIASRRRARLLR